MKTKDLSRFDLDTLCALAGDKVFARGEAYHRAGQVEILSLESERVLAQVAGTDDYRTVLMGRGESVDGECSCPYFEDRGFCKHLVATALAANAANADDGAEGVGALARIRNHLKGRGVDALVEMIVGLAERDPALFRRLDLAAATDHADDKTLEARLRKAIDDATRTRRFVDYSRAPGWAAGVGAVLDTLADLASGARAGLVLKLAEYAISRIERAVENMDDSDGHCGALLECAQRIHFEACRTAKPDPAALARDLFTREMEGEYDTFYGAAALYADMLGEEGLAEYRRLAMAAWNKLPSRTVARRATDDFSFDHFRLASIMDFFAEREGDVDARIALRAKDLTSPWSFLQLAEFCLAQGRADEALRHAEEGLWMFEDGRPDERLVFFAADLLSRAGRKKDAAAHLWRAFEKAPSLELYARLRKLGGKAARERALTHLTGRLAKAKSTLWNSPADLLIRILMSEKMLDAAWAAVREHGAASGLKESLAKASEVSYPQEALEVYVERVEELVEAGGNPGYEEACGLIARMAALRSAAGHAAYVADLKERFRRKRNFMKLLG